MVEVAFDGSHQRLGSRSVPISQAHEAYLLFYPESVTWKPDEVAASENVFQVHVAICPNGSRWPGGISEIAKVGRPAPQVARARVLQFHIPHEELNCSDLAARSDATFQGT